MKLETTQKVEMQVGLIAVRLFVFVLFSWLWIWWNYDEREEAFFQIWLLAPFMELSSILVSFLPTRFWKSKKSNGVAVKQHLVAERPYCLIVIGFLLLHAVVIAYPVRMQWLDFWAGCSILPGAVLLTLLFLFLKRYLKRGQQKQ